MLSFTGSSGAIVVNSINADNSRPLISSGTLRSGGKGTSVEPNSLTIGNPSGTLQYSAGNQTDYSGRFSTANNQAYNVDTNGQNVTFATKLTSSGGSLTKLGAATTPTRVARRCWEVPWL